MLKSSIDLNIVLVGLYTVFAYVLYMLKLNWIMHCETVVVVAIVIVLNLEQGSDLTFSHSRNSVSYRTNICFIYIIKLCSQAM